MKSLRMRDATVIGNCKHSPMRTRRLAVILLVALAAVTGCASNGPSQATPVATPVAEPTPAPSETVPPELVRAFDGDCGAVFTDADAVLGFDASLGENDAPTGVGTLGGIRCNWTAVDDVWEHLALTALPVPQVPDELQSRYETTACDWSYDTLDCHLAGSAGGTWVMVSKSMLDENGPTPDLAPVLAAALETAAAAPEPVAATRTADWWEPADCATLEVAADIAEVYAPATFEPGYPSGFGEWPTDEVVAPFDQWCPWYSYDTSEAIWMNLLPGAGSQWEHSSFDGATPVEVTGAQSAVLVSTEDREVLYATDGANVLRITMSPIPMPDLAARVFAAMG